MRFFLLPLLLSALASCSAHVGSITGKSATPVKTPHFTLRQDVIYTPAGWPQALPANIYQPAGAGPWPGVLLIHGGSWRTKDRRSDMDAIAECLARRGYVVMNVTYRLAPRHVHPAQVQDLRQALSWMHSHARELHLQSDRLATFGYSAGGHLAALVGSVDTRIKAVVAGGAPTDLRKFPDSPDVVGYLGGTLEQKPAAYANASPVAHVSAGDPPVFIYHGSLDKLVPVDHATDYRTALNRSRVPAELIWLKGRGHIAAFLIDSDAIQPSIDFLDRHLRPES